MAIKFRNEVELKEAIGKAKTLKESITKAAESFAGELANLKAYVESRVADTPPALRDSARKVYDNEARVELKKLQDATRAATKAPMQELEQLKMAANTYGKLFGDSKTLGTMYGVSSPALMARRTALTQEVQGMRGASILSLSELAKLNDDHLLASVLLNRVDAMPRGDRPFDPKDFANELFGPQAKITNAMIGEVESAFQEGETLALQIEGKATPFRKIEIGIAKGELGNVAAFSKPRDPMNLTPNEKIESALAAQAAMDRMEKELDNAE